MKRPLFEAFSRAERDQREHYYYPFLCKSVKLSMEKTVTEMFSVGAHYGYTKTRRHASVKPFLYGTKNRTDIIDLEKTFVQLETAQDIMKTLGSTGKQVLFVGSKPEAKDAVKAAAEALNMPYVDIRWIGGTLTNEKQIKSRVTLYEDLSDKQEKNALVTITKKEKLLLERKITKLGKMFGGLTTMKGLPAAMVVIDSLQEDIAVTEANKMGIPVISLSNTDNDIRLVSYPILANDSNKKAIEWFLSKLTEAYKGNK